jgi:hypothetical protein
MKKVCPRQTQPCEGWGRKKAPYPEGHFLYGGHRVGGWGLGGNNLNALLIGEYL